MLRRIQDMNPGPLSNESVTLAVPRGDVDLPVTSNSHWSVAFLGPLGSFTGSAATKHFGHAARLLPQSSIDDVFREVEAGHAHYAVVPVENSTEGAVGRSMDLLFSTPLKICGEVVLRIHQNLMTRETSLDKVTKVYSHAQSLAQCHEWLNRNLPNVPRISVGSNSQAAEMAMQEDGAAAIAGEAAAERFSVPILVANIEDEPNNTTRFVVLGRFDAGVSGRDKTSLIMSAPNRTGSLHGLPLPPPGSRRVDDPARIAPGAPYAVGLCVLR